MKVNKLICACCDICDIPYLQEDMEVDLQTAIASPLVNKMVAAYRLCLQQLFDAFPTRLVHTAYPTDGKIELPLAGRVLSVTDACGCEVPFTFAGDAICVDSKERLLVTYAMAAPEIDWLAEAPLPRQASHRLALIGTVAGYYAMCGDASFLDCWQQLFDKELARHTKPPRAGTLPVGKWIV